MTGLRFMLAALILSPSAALSLDREFYTNRGLSIVVGTEPGTGFDIYARLLARHVGRHVEGNPRVVIQNMPGGGGVTAANWLYNVAPKDGSTMATFVLTAPLEPLFGNPQARFDPAHFTWIGNMESSVALCGVTRAAGVRSFSDLQKKGGRFGATGPTGSLATSALAVRNGLNAPIQVVTGYKGSADIKAAMGRGEVEGICGLPWSTVKSIWRQELHSGDFIPVLQLSGEKLSIHGELAHYEDLLKSDEDRQLFGVIFGVQALGRTFAAPPQIPPGRATILRAAFAGAMQDQQLLAEARKADLDVQPMTGEEVAARWRDYVATPADVLERAKKISRRETERH